jgi:sigma-E factor negative regulatory protein RseB
MNRRRLTVPTSLLFFLASLSAQAAGEAQDWLMRIHQAPQELNYEGTFVYQQGAQLETMRIYHRATGGVVTERLASLTGPAREVVRTNEEVRCYLPDQKSVLIEDRRLDHKGFLAIVPERLPELQENYAIELGGMARVAGRPARLLVVRARDDYRYGYRLWADQETGLLLKADLMDDKSKVLEQFMFTQIDIGNAIPDAALQPQTPTSGMVLYRDTEVAEGDQPKNWRAVRVPKGFKLSSSIVRRLPKAGRVVEQFVYSDSLAAISVFVEKLEGAEGGAELLEGPRRMGALFALGKILDGHHVTVVGEVPSKTIVMIGNSLVLTRTP